MAVAWDGSLEAARALKNAMPLLTRVGEIHVLLYAAKQAPTGMHAEPWAFAVIQNRGLLDPLSETARQIIWPTGPDRTMAGRADTP